MNLNTVFSRLLVASFLIISFSVNAADDSLTQSSAMWKSLKSKISINRVTEDGVSLPLVTRALHLDELGLKTLLDENISDSDAFFARGFSSGGSENNIVLPLPDGTEVSFKVVANDIMPDALAEKYPDIKTWKVKSVDDAITGVIDFTHHGFHGMLFMPNGDRVFIEPNVESSTASERKLSNNVSYISYSQKANAENFKTEFSCGLDDSNTTLNFSKVAKTTATLAQRILSNVPTTVITYRLAVATTGEYTQFHGGTVANGLSAVVTTISRVNEIYLRDFGIQFELVEEQEDIIYTNASTDPYTNSDTFSLIEENDQNLSSNGDLSKDRYDIGHVFSAGNVGGLAGLGVVCIDSGKALGATGISTPLGDAFALDYVAHELGHQLGANHTFNSECGERSSDAAVEPGSGTTIMSYAGICGDDNIQSNVDAQFHIVSIDEINKVTRTGTGTICGTSVENINEIPTVDAGDDFAVPARTPIRFVATGSDADSDNDLTYSWEQTDIGSVSSLNVDTGDNALFRSREVTSDNVRYIPSLSDLFAGTYSDGELLPITDREITMAVTIRDGVGGLEADDVIVDVVNTGEIFSITSHTFDQSFGREDSVDMTWEVADTNLSPISCSSVDIGVITADGTEFTILTTDNDGDEQFVIPDDAPAMNNARFILSCSDSHFFHLSTGEITILDQVNGGSVLSDISVELVDYGTDSNSNSNSNSSDNGFVVVGGNDDNDDDDDGGGPYSFIMLLLGSLLLFIQQTIKIRVRNNEKN